MPRPRRPPASESCVCVCVMHSCDCDVPRRTHTAAAAGESPQCHCHPPRRRLWSFSCRCSLRHFALLPPPAPWPRSTPPPPTPPMIRAPIRHPRTIIRCALIHLGLYTTPRAPVASLLSPLLYSSCAACLELCPCLRCVCASHLSVSFLWRRRSRRVRFRSAASLCV